MNADTQELQTLRDEFEEDKSKVATFAHRGLGGFGRGKGGFREGLGRV